MSAYSDAVLADGPWMYYRLAEANGATVMVDSSGNGRNGTYAGSTLPTPAASLNALDASDGARKFGPSSGYATTASGTLPSPRYMTVEFFTKTTGSYGSFVNQDSATGSQRAWKIDLSGGSLYVYNPYYNYHVYGPILADGVPHHVVVVFANGTVDMWVDGIKKGTANLSTFRSSVAGLHIGIGGNLAGQIDATMDDVAIYDRVLAPERIQAHYAATQPPKPQVVDLGRATEVDTAARMYFYAPSPASIDLGRVDEVDTASTLTPTGKIYGTPQSFAMTAGAGLIRVKPNLTLIILDDTLDRAPTSVQVMVDGCDPGASLTFDIDGTEVWTDVASIEGELGQSSLPVPEALGAAGTHTLTVTSGSQTSSATFTLDKGPPASPTVMTPDAQPVLIAGTEGRWVFQDLMPTGLGSYVLPFNPTSMTSPHRTRAITGEHTTAPDGQFHLSEAGHGQKTWKLSGYYETQAFSDQLKAYGELDRRWYVIDHRGRAWKVASMGLTLQPRKRQSDATSPINDDAGNWVLDLILMSQDWSTPT